MLLTDLENISEVDLIDILVAATPVAYIILDKNFRVHFINEHFMELRKMKKEEVLGKKCYDLSNKGVKCKVCAVAEAIGTGRKSRLLRKDILEDGDIRYIDDYAIPLPLHDGGEIDYILEIMVNRDKEMKFRRQLDNDFREIIQVLSTLLELKDIYTATHSKNVRTVSIQIAMAMKLSDEEIFDIDIAASLHDIGKIYVSTDIINKPSNLTDEEYEIIKQHPTKSKEIINHLSGFQNAKKIVEYHHERYDGTGYPKGLKGKEIPIGARIIAVADTYDAMTSTRSYREALDHKIAIDEIRNKTGTQFDPEVVNAFMKHMNIEAIKDCNMPEWNRSFYEGHERLIQSIAEEELKKEEFKSFKELHDIITEEQFVQVLFNNTPVGYVIMDQYRNIQYTNDYFYSLAGVDKEEKQFRKCTDFNIEHKMCRSCMLARVIKTGEIVTEQVKRNMPSGVKYLQAFAIPLLSNGKNYVIEILFDQTEEYKLQRQHEKDLSELIKVLSSLLFQGKQNGNQINLISLAIQIATELGLAEEEVHNIEIASSLCDVGLIFMEKELKELPLIEINRIHPIKSVEILSNLSGFEEIKAMIRYHHEPYKKDRKEEQEINIPLGARIILAAHILCKHNISNIEELTKEQINDIKLLSGILLDPKVVNIICKKSLPKLYNNIKNIGM